MAKSRKRRTKAEPTTTARSRREVMVLLRNGAIGAAVVGSAGVFGARSFRAHAAEHDLSRIGQGDPVVVQVHDPSCPMCTALQKQTRAALAACDAGRLTYLVADINTDAGRAFALRHGVGHVTLVLLDGQGAMRRTVQGVHTQAELQPILAAHKAETA